MLKSEINNSQNIILAYGSPPDDMYLEYRKKIMEILGYIYLKSNVKLYMFKSKEKSLFTKHGFPIHLSYIKYYNLWLEEVCLRPIDFYKIIQK